MLIFFLILRSGDGTLLSMATIQDGTDVEVQVVRTAATSPLYGTFSFAFQGEQSRSLPHDASAEEVEAALEAFHYIDDVTVTRTGPDAYNQDKLSNADYDYLGNYLDYSSNMYSWTITFNSHVGPMAPLGVCCDSRFAFAGKQTLFAVGSEDATITVEEARKGTGKPLAGSFTITVDDNVTTSTTEPIAFDASALELATMLSNLTITGNVSVTRSDDDENGQLTWSITFVDWQSGRMVSVQDIGVDYSALDGTKAYMTWYTEGDWDRKETQQISSQVNAGNISSCVVTSASGSTRALPAFPFNGTARDLQSSFDSLGSGFIGEVKVSLSSSINGGNGSVWVVAFLESLQNIPIVNCGSEAKVEILHYGTPTALGGHFRLGYDGNSTVLIPYNATAGEVQSALQDLPGLGNVTVSGGMTSGPNLIRKWNVTFGNIYADVPSLQADASQLSGTSPFVDVKEIQKGSQVGGSFTLTILGNTTVPIRYNATPSKLERALLSFHLIDAVNVTRTERGNGMCSWTISFLHMTPSGEMSKNAGDLAPLLVDGSDLTGYGDFINVTTLQNGTNPIRGKFRLSYGGKTTRKISYRAPADWFEVLLEELPALPKGLTVTRTGPDDSGGFIWRVKLPLGYQTNSSLQVDGSGLLGSQPKALVHVTRNATSPISGTFNLGYSRNGTPGYDYTSDLPWNVSAAALASYLMALKDLPGVSVSSEIIENAADTSYNGARRYHVTFTSVHNAGPQKLLLVNRTNLHGTNLVTKVFTKVQGSSAKVQQLTIANYTGFFSLAFDLTNATYNRTFVSAPLPYNINASNLSDSLTALPGVGNLQVERQDIVGGSRWSLLFADHFDDAPSFWLNSTQLKQKKPQTLAEIVTSTNSTARPLYGSLSLVYGQRCSEDNGGVWCDEGQTYPLTVGNITVDTVTEALLSLPSIINVSVDISSTPLVGLKNSIVAHGYLLRVTFHEVALNMSRSVSNTRNKWTWIPPLAGKMLSGELVTGGELLVNRIISIFALAFP